METEQIKKSRGYFPNTKEGQKEYEKQWEDDTEFDFIVVSTVGYPFDWNK